MTRPIDAVLFDKDGTLFDFSATWDVWAEALLRSYADGDQALLGRLADSTRFDLASGTFFPDSPIIAGTARQAAECVASVMTWRSVTEIESHMVTSSADAPLAPAVPLAPLLDGMRAAGLRLGVMTNDSEYGARRNLQEAQVLDRFDFIAGFDSGYGAKPDPDPLLAFADAVEVAPERVVMVGDSTHDLTAGRAAGMATAGVLTGPAKAPELAPFADVIFPDIGHLPAWLGHG